MAQSGEKVGANAGEDAGAPSQKVQWVDDAMATQFANVVNVQGTREQIDLFFGTNKTWNVAEIGGMSVDLSNRLILTPLAAKRLWTVLGGVLREHESRYGPLNVDQQG